MSDLTQRVPQAIRAPSGLQLYWRLDEPSGLPQDSSGNARHATAIGVGNALNIPRYAHAGDRSTSCYFDNANGQITAGTYSPYAVGASLTFVGWAHAFSYGDLNFILYGDGATPPYGYFDTSVAFYFRPQSGGAQMSWPGGPGGWFHWALTYNDTTRTGELFINGVSKGQQTLAAGNGFSGNGGHFLLSAQGGSNSFQGMMADVAIYNRILNPDEIFSLYRAGAWQTPYPFAVMQTGPSLYWRLNETAGTTADDWAGQQSNGTYTAPGVTLAQPGAMPTEPGALSALFIDSNPYGAITGPALIAAGGNYTFMGWANRNNTSGIDVIFSGTGSDCPFLYLSGGFFHFRPVTAGDVAWTDATTPGRWFHWALTYTDSTKVAELFLNGVSQGTRTCAAGIGTAAAVGNFAVGQPGGLGNTWGGYMQDVALWQYNIGAANIATIYDAGRFADTLSDQAPAICVEIDVTNDPTSGTVTWENVTPYVVAYQRNPVRTNEFDQPGPATAQVTLRNDDARFIPDNATGPYYGLLKPYRRIRVRALWNGVTYARFWGYVRDWPQAWAAFGYDQKVVLDCVDAMTPLETFDLVGQSFASSLSGAAIQAILTAAGVPASTLDSGWSTIDPSGTLAVNSFALQRVRDIAASENGVVFANGAGQVAFHDRRRRLTGGSSATVQATIGDGGAGAGEIPYVDPDPAIGDVWPIVQVTPLGGSVQRVSDPGGVASYFGRTLNFPAGGQYLVSSAAEALSAAQYLVNRYIRPLTRIRSITLLGVGASSLWATILSLDTSSRVIFRRRYRSGNTIGGTMSLNEFVEGVGDQVTIGKDWRIVSALSPADPQSYWLVADPVYGLLDTTTRLGY